MAIEIPKIISVDDHVIEPGNVWQDRLPEKFKAVGPRIERKKLKSMNYQGGNFSFEYAAEGEDGYWCDWWYCEDLRSPMTRLSAAAGYPAMKSPSLRSRCKTCAPVFGTKRIVSPTWISIMWKRACAFPSFPRFCGQAFYERKDRELGDLCVKAYNDWMLDEWCAGTDGRLIPLIIIQLWDPQLAAAEIRRNAAKGCRAVTFSEIPPFLGLPSMHDKDRFWDPLLQACEETGTVINMHIGSSSKMPSTSGDTPAAVSSTLTYMNAAMSLTDWLMSGIFERFPTLKIAYSEGQIGWIPYVLERADKVWEDNRAWGGVVDIVKRPPSEYYYSNVYGCFFDDPHGLQNIEAVGEDNITFETDYPHSDSTWPDTEKVALEIMSGLTQEQVNKVCRGNAIKMLQLDFKP